MRLTAFAVSLVLSTQIGMSKAADLPMDVRNFLEQREGCDHLRGEYGDDEARQYEINKNTCELCQGTDKALASLKRKYRKNEDVSASLKALQPKVEDPSPQAMVQACMEARRNPRKPQGVATNSRQ